MKKFWNWLRVTFHMWNPEPIIVSDLLAFCPLCGHEDQKVDMIYDRLIDSYFCTGVCKEMWYSTEYIN